MVLNHILLSNTCQKFGNNYPEIDKSMSLFY